MNVKVCKSFGIKQTTLPRSAEPAVPLSNAPVAKQSLFESAKFHIRIRTNLLAVIMKKFVGIGFRHALRTVHAASSYRAPCYAAPFHAAHSGASRLLHTAPPLLYPAGKEKEGEEATAVAGFGDYYSVLSLDRDCSAADVKAGYVKIARACHPDVTDSTEAAASFQRAARVCVVIPVCCVVWCGRGESYLQSYLQSYLLV